MSYKNLLKEIEKNVKEKGSRNYSKSDQVDLMKELVNDVDHEATIVSKDAAGGVKKTTINATKNFRENVIRKAMIHGGLDKADAQAASETYQVDKAGAESLVTLGMIAMKDYLGTGRKVVLPTTEENEAVMSIQIGDVAEKVEATKKIEQQEDGSYASVPTGKTVKTEAHTKLIAKNKVPDYLKSEVQ